MIERNDDTAMVSKPSENSLIGLPDECGCAEVWEHLSERRTEGVHDE